MEAALDGGSDGLGSPAPGMTMAEAASTSLPGVGEPPPDVGGVSYDALGGAGLAPGVLGGAPGLLGGAPGLLGAPPRRRRRAGPRRRPASTTARGRSGESLAAAAAAAYPLPRRASLGALPYGAVGAPAARSRPLAPVYQAAQALAQASSYGGGDAKLGAKARARARCGRARDPSGGGSARDFTMAEPEHAPRPLVEEEHKQFLDLMTKYGRSWTRISQGHDGARAAGRSPAQKHFLA
ncbi:hypothetical protein SO694_00108066 [Aureococcus anophagefferens]|uniref:Myb-like domain-containing protein n=1 Tax=Aureococcus anophagefferens TaxID=44056 RepID=A0ABR1FM53_AURAN